MYLAWNKPEESKKIQEELINLIRKDYMKEEEAKDLIKDIVDKNLK